jgi:hypothetical protein
LLFSCGVFAQTDWVRWEKSDPTYQKKDSFIERNYDFSIESVSDILLNQSLARIGFLFQTLMAQIVRSILLVQVFLFNQLKKQIHFKVH